MLGYAKILGSQGRREENSSKDIRKENFKEVHTTYWLREKAE